MYTLAAIDRYSFPSSPYVTSLTRLSNHILTSTSSQQLSLHTPSSLSSGPISTWTTSHGNLTAVQPFSPEEGLVCTAGEDGTVGVWDLRVSGQKACVVKFKASEAPIMSMACHGRTKAIAVGTELYNHEASILVWDIRASPSPSASYPSLHSDDITHLSFSPSPDHPSYLLSGSTDGLLSIHDLSIPDEDDLTVQTFNHNASIHHAGFLSATEVVALSHDEQFAVYDMAEERNSGDAIVNWGDVRGVLGCQYVADVTPKLDGSGAIIGSGAQDNRTFSLTFLSRHPESTWVLNKDDSVVMPGAHGEEIVRSFCFFDEEQVVFTAGEDGQVKAWR